MQQINPSDEVENLVLYSICQDVLKYVENNLEKHWKAYVKIVKVWKQTEQRTEELLILEEKKRRLSFASLLLSLDWFAT